MWNVELNQTPEGPDADAGQLVLNCQSLGAVL